MLAHATRFRAFLQSKRVERSQRRVERRTGPAKITGASPDPCRNGLRSSAPRFSVAPMSEPKELLTPLADDLWDYDAPLRVLGMALVTG